MTSIVVAQQQYGLLWKDGDLSDSTQSSMDCGILSDIEELPGKKDYVLY